MKDKRRVSYDNESKASAVHPQYFVENIAQLLFIGLPYNSRKVLKLHTDVYVQFNKLENNIYIFNTYFIFKYLFKLGRGKG